MARDLTISLPKLGDIDPEIPRIEAKLADIGQRRAAIKRQLEDLRPELTKAPPPPVTAAPDTALAEALGEEFAGLAGAVSPASDERTRAAWARAGALTRDDEALSRAFDILSADLRPRRGRASIKLCESARAAYDAQVADISTTAAALFQAIEQHQRFLDDLQADGGSAAALDVLPTRRLRAEVETTLSAAARRLVDRRAA